MPNPRSTHCFLIRLALVLAAALPIAARAQEPAPQEQPPTPPTEQASAPDPQPEPADPAPPTPRAPAPPEPIEPGREVIVTLRDGQRYTGILVERTPERVTLRIAGIDTPIPATFVDRIHAQPPLLERYRSMRAAIDHTDTDRLLLLIDWLRAREQWELALAELDHVADLLPDSPELKRLRTLIESQRNLAVKSAAAREAARPAAGEPAAPDAGRDEEFPLLSDRDVNLIKVYEIDLSDPPRIIISRDTITRLLDEHAATPLIPETAAEREAFYRMSPTRILDAMFRVQARELYPEVRVLDHPRAMRQFRDNVHRSFIANSCATTRCHGGGEAGRLMLATRRPNADATFYTNFLILERFRLPGGAPLIDYDNPPRSPLLQYGLPRDLAAHKHPVVPGPGGRGDLWRPFFRGTEDRRFVEAADWIKSMYRPRPEYPITYSGPGPEPLPARPDEPPIVR